VRDELIRPMFLFRFKCKFLQVPPRNLLTKITVLTTLTVVVDAEVIKEDVAVEEDPVAAVAEAIVLNAIVLMTIETALDVGKNPSFSIISLERSIRPGDPITREAAITIRTTITEAATTTILATTRKIGKCRWISIRTVADRGEAGVAPDETKITTRFEFDFKSITVTCKT